jgi:hypothetical protein
MVGTRGRKYEERDFLSESGQRELPLGKQMWKNKAKGN